MTPEVAGLPETYLLLTRRGDLHIDDVVVGDETIDANGRWVKVEAIHRHESIMLETWTVPRKTPNQAPEFSPVFTCTAGQRWVHSLYRDKGQPRYTIETHWADRPLPKRAPERYGLKLAFVPKTGSWIAKGLAQIEAVTPRERSAALVAMMESSTRDCTFHWAERTLEIWERPDAKGLGAELLSLIPEEIILTHEQSHRTWDGTRHLITIDPSRVVNLPRGDMLKWVRDLEQSEVEAFFTTYWYLNGETRHETRDYPYRAKVPVRNYESNRLQAMQLAAFRSGNLGRVVRTKGNVAEKKIGLVEGKIGAHKYAMSRKGKAAAWSITTSSGTLSVWAPVGNEHAYIVTGHQA